MKTTVCIGDTFFDGDRTVVHHGQTVNSQNRFLFDIMALKRQKLGYHNTSNILSLVAADVYILERALNRG